MDAFTKKTLKVSRGYTYTYYTLDGDRSLPTLLFQHGWPENAQMWEPIATKLKASGFTHSMIIPDTLGYDGTSKPTDPGEYSWDKMTKDMIEIIDAEGYEKVISIGHDWGCVLAARLYNYHPGRVVGLSLLNVVYAPPARNTYSLDALNNIFEQAFGYPCYAYWHLFSAPDGPEVLLKNLDRLYSAVYCQGEEAMKDLFCTSNRMREYLESTEEEKMVSEYARNPEFKQAWLSRMSRDGFEGPQCWYKATANNIQKQCDSQLPADRDKVTVPTLFIGCKKDVICRPEMMTEAKKKGLLPNLEETPLLDAGHFSPYESPEEVAEYLEDWLKRKF